MWSEIITPLQHRIFLIENILKGNNLRAPCLFDLVGVSLAILS